VRPVLILIAAWLSAAPAPMRNGAAAVAARTALRVNSILSSQQFFL
jgi:hypothetical protein